MALQNRRLSHYLWHSRRRTCYSSADNWSQTRNIRELRKGRLLSLLFFVATMSQHVSQVKVAMGQPQLSYKGSLRDEVKLKHAKRRLKRTKEEADKTIFQIIAIKFLLKNRNWPSEQFFVDFMGKTRVRLLLLSVEKVYCGYGYTAAGTRNLQKALPKNAGSMDTRT